MTSHSFHLTFTGKSLTRSCKFTGKEGTAARPTLCTKGSVCKACSGFPSDPDVLRSRTRCPPPQVPIMLYRGHMEFIFLHHSTQLLLHRSLLQPPHTSFLFPAPSKACSFTSQGMQPCSPVSPLCSYRRMSSPKPWEPLQPAQQQG